MNTIYNTQDHHHDHAHWDNDDHDYEHYDDQSCTNWIKWNWDKWLPPGGEGWKFNQSKII